MPSIWLDSRAAEMAAAFVAGPDHAAHYATTGTGLNACQQSIQLAWLQRHQPERLAKAASALHCKDWLYFKLTGKRAVDPAEGVFTYGDFRNRELRAGGRRTSRHRAACPSVCPISSMAPAPITALPTRPRPTPGCRADCRSCSAMSMWCVPRSEADCMTQPVRSVARFSVRPACTCEWPTSADAVSLNAACSGYTMALPDAGLYAQIQSNMAATVNIDWLVELARQACAMAGIESHRHALLAGVEAHVAAARAGEFALSSLHPAGRRARPVHECRCAGAVRGIVDKHQLRRLCFARSTRASALRPGIATASWAVFRTRSASPEAPRARSTLLQIYRRYTRTRRCDA